MDSRPTLKDLCELEERGGGWGERSGGEGSGAYVTCSQTDGFVGVGGRRKSLGNTRAKWTIMKTTPTSKRVAANTAVSTHTNIDDHEELLILHY